VKVCDLTGDELDYWVAKAEGFDAAIHEYRGCLITSRSGVESNYAPSSRWEHGGEIIERERIMICEEGIAWGASPPNGCWNPGEYSAREMGPEYGYGPTPLVAAMRAYVTEKFGDAVLDLDSECITQGGVFRI
jgi:hypothetical protein